MNIKPAAFSITATGVLLASLMTPVKAEQTGDSTSYEFLGRFLISSTCTISNDQVMDVSFGNVGVKKVDGTNFMQTIPYTVDCHGVPDNTVINLSVSGTATTFDNAAVTTSAEGLGIQIQSNGHPMKLNQVAVSVSLSQLQSMVLTAVPVKDPTKELTAQIFSATATLTAAYQ